VVATLVVVTPFIDDEMVTELYPELELDVVGAGGDPIVDDVTEYTAPPLAFALLVQVPL
jgi:hypothetical protein